MQPDSTARGHTPTQRHFAASDGGLSRAVPPPSLSYSCDCLWLREIPGGSHLGSLLCAGGVWYQEENRQNTSDRTPQLKLIHSSTSTQAPALSPPHNPTYAFKILRQNCTQIHIHKLRKMATLDLTLALALALAVAPQRNARVCHQVTKTMCLLQTLLQDTRGMSCETRIMVSCADAIHIVQLV